MDSGFEGQLRLSCHVGVVLRLGPYAIIPHEPCQAGNRAALSDKGNVPKANLGLSKFVKGRVLMLIRFYGV